ncbi:hypothetical protein PGT21_002037 [Puccinia graminis f. sp. tritici]|uniref:Uncharacterized protein n=1 Tax=Puccinia graminis f. sp. tritici TaxID=56615 RepID=A0A5B0N339_PUCGR|nr:hypothetical protein PGT21_002037 [Puccinia graminis f. sp. tritici]
MSPLPTRLATGVMMLPTGLNQLLGYLPLQLPTKSGIYSDFPISLIRPPPMDCVLPITLDGLRPLLVGLVGDLASNDCKEVTEPIVYLQLWLKFSHKSI